MGIERGNIACHVASPPDRLLDSVKINDRRRCLRRNPTHIPVAEAVQHQVADH